jgi:Zn-dependent M28 family amino/carboxypeptidase
VKESLGDGGLYFGSDQVEFAKVGIPAAFPFSGFDYVGHPKDYGDGKWEAYAKKDYHEVSDEVKPDWDYTGAAGDARWLMIAGQLVADAEERPKWKPGSEFHRMEMAR